MEEQEQKNTPVGIKVISILNYILATLGFIFAFVGVIGGIIFILNGSSFAQQIFGIPKIGTLGAEIVGEAGLFYIYFGYFAVVFGIVSLLAALLLVLTGVKMWNGKNWARVMQIILSGLWTILASIELFKGNFLSIILVIPSVVIIIYLIFSKKVRGFFAQSAIS